MSLFSAIGGFFERIFGSTPAAPPPGQWHQRGGYRHGGGGYGGGQYAQPQYAQPQYAPPAPMPLNIPPGTLQQLPPVPAPTTSMLSTASSLTADGMGIAHMAPGAMGTEILAVYGAHLDLEVDGGGHFVSFASDNENVVSSLNLSSYAGSGTASMAAIGPGSANVTISWVDASGNPETSTIIVQAS